MTIWNALLILGKVINDLSSLLEDANITVSNLLTFSPDESDITDQLEILQVLAVDIL